MMYDDPMSLLSHIQQEFENRIQWDWKKILQRHNKTHHKRTSRNPQTTMELKWGQIIQIEPKGNQVALVLPVTRPE
jgi:hypothetical protein